MNGTDTPPPTVSSRLLIGCRRRLSPGGLAAIGPSVSSPSLAWIHAEVGEGLDAGMLSNIWHVPTPPLPSPSSAGSPSSFKQQRAGDLTRGGSTRTLLFVRERLRTPRLEHEGFLCLSLSQWTVTLVTLS